MPRIPVYNQQLVPNATPGVTRARSSAAIGESMQAVGRGLANVAEYIDRKDQMAFVLEKERIETEGKIWAASASSQADLDMATHLQKRQQEATPGAANFTPEFLKSYDEYSEGALKNAPSKYAKSLLQAHFGRSREAYGKSAMIWEASERARYTGEQIDTGVQNSAKLIYTNPDWFEQEMGKWNGTISSAPVDEAAKAKMRDQARKNLAWSSVSGQIDRDAKTWLALTDDERGTAWNLLNLPEQQKALEYADRKVNEARQELAVNLRYDIQNAEAMARTGIAPAGPARTREEFMAAFKDERTAEYEWARYTTARQTATAVASLSGKSSTELLAVVQQKPNPKDPNFAVAAANQEIRARAAADIIRERQQDPVAYAIQSGDFKLKPLNPQDPAAFAEELKRRSAAVPGMSEKYGRASVLSKAEASVLAQQLDLMPADRKVEQLETMRRSIGDDMVYAAALNAIRPDSPVTALVGSVAAAGSKENARMIARGEDLLNPTKGGRAADGKGSGAAFPMPTETLMRQAWVDAVGDAYRGYPDAEATAYQAFKAYYASAAAQRGLNDPKASPDDRIVRSALNASTGGIMRWKTDWFGNSTPSANIVLPYGMAEDVFRDRVTAEWLRVRETVGYSKTDVGDIGLYNTGANGEYMVMSGTSWLPGKDGKPVILRVK